MADNVSVDDMKNAMSTQKVKYLNKGVVFPNRLGSVLPPVVEDKLTEVGDENTDITQFVDLIPDCTENFDFDALTNILHDSKPKYMDLPSPLAPKVAPPPETVMQIAIIEHTQAPGHYAIFKWFTFMRDGKTCKQSKAIAMNLCHNTPRLIRGCGTSRVSYIEKRSERLAQQAQNSI